MVVRNAAWSRIVQEADEAGYRLRHGKLVYGRNEAGGDEAWLSLDQETGEIRCVEGNQAFTLPETISFEQILSASGYDADEDE